MRAALVIVPVLLLAIAPAAAKDVESQLPSKTLERALTLYDKGDYLSATIELHKVLSGETADAPAQVQRAQFFQAKTLYQLKFFTGTHRHLDQIVNAGAGHPYRVAAVKWILALDKAAPAGDARGLLALLAGYGKTELDSSQLDAVRRELNLALARQALGTGDAKGALARLAGDSDGRARWLEGVAQQRLGKDKEARAAFEKAAAADDAPSAALALLALARARVAAGEHAKAIALYAKIPTGAAESADAQFETSAAQLAKDRALGALAPFAAGGPAVDILGGEPSVLGVVAWADFCRAGARKDLLAAVAKDWKKARAELVTLQEIAAEDASEFYEWIVRIDARKSGLSPLAEALVGVVARRSPQVRLHRDLVAALAAEEQLWNASDAAWRTTALAADVLQEIVLVDALAKATVGKLAAVRVGLLIDGIDALLAAAGKKPPVLATSEAKAKNSLRISPDVCR